MNTERRRCLDRAVADAAAAFAFVDAQPAADTQPVDPATWVKIAVFAPTPGTLVLGMSADAVEEMTRTAWGAFATGSDEQRNGFLFELMNVIAGRFLAELDPQASVELGFPEVVTEAPPLVAQYDLEGRRMAVG
ncbi:MAG: chemotaxis protein CheX, partial [Myxococcota bacterium]